MESNLTQFANQLLASTNRRENLGPLQNGHYIQVGLGFGFYVPESDFQALQELANTTGRIQFLGVTRDGAPIYGSRDEIAARPDSAGCIAWIVPR